MTFSGKKCLPYGSCLSSGGFLYVVTALSFTVITKHASNLFQEGMLLITHLSMIYFIISWFCSSNLAFPYKLDILPLPKTLLIHSLILSIFPFIHRILCLPQSSPTLASQSSWCQPVQMNSYLYWPIKTWDHIPSLIFQHSSDPRSKRFPTYWWPAVSLGMLAFCGRKSLFYH